MDNNELQHWGIKGMRWGHRRFQNKDGSLTPAGRERYNDDDMDGAYEQGKKDAKKERRKKLLIAGAAAAATALAIIGVKKLADSKNSGSSDRGKKVVDEALAKLKAEREAEKAKKREDNAYRKRLRQIQKKQFKTELKTSSKQNGSMKTLQPFLWQR